MRLLKWLENALGVIVEGITNEDYYNGARLGCLEAIKSGTTSLLAFEQTNIDPEIGNKVINAISESGIRGVLGWGLQDIGHQGGSFETPFPNTDDNLKNLEVAVKKWSNSFNGKIRVWPAFITGPICSSELMIRTKELANKHDLGITIHIDETPEAEFWGFTYPKIKAPDGVGFYDELVGLDSNVLLVHCCWTTNEGIARMAKKGAHVSHNTNSNMYLASGIAKVPEMLKQGVNVSLGVDGATSNNNQDMFEIIKNTALLHKVNTLDPKVITAEQVLEMATVNGAKALLMEDEVGSLVVGKRADVIVVNLKEANTSPSFYVPSTLVYCANGSNVDTVVIDGKLVMEGRVVKTVNEEEVIRDAQRSMDKILESEAAKEIKNRAWPIV
jgi:5-methylthioadenosine/S-adenosylhomocysteine deaminase